MSSAICADSSGIACVILDPCSLLLLPQLPPDSQLPKKLLRRLLCTRTWFLYQRGRLSLTEATIQLSHLPFVPPSLTPAHMCRLLCPTGFHALPCMQRFLDFLRDELHLKLVCILNSSAQEAQALRRLFPGLFASFHVSVTSSEEGVGKPSLRFLQIALKKADMQARQTLYLDTFESLESIMAARSLGMPVLSFEQALIDELHKVASPDQLRDVQLIQRIVSAVNSSRSPSRAAMETCTTPPPAPASAPTKPNTLVSAEDDATLLLRRRAAVASGRQFIAAIIAAHPPEKPFIQVPSLTSEGIFIYDNFAQFLVAELLDDVRFLPLQAAPPNGLFTFVNRSAYLAAGKLNGKFYASDACTFVDIPNDLDTTSIGLSVLHKFGRLDSHILNNVLDRMMEYVSDDDGILQVYFDLERPRIDPVAATNAIYLFYLGKRGHEVQKSVKFVESVLSERAYKDGTLYYNLGEAFLMSVARLVNKFDEHFGVGSKMREVLQEALREEVGHGVKESDDALALAMRIRACALCGLQDEGITGDAEQELVRRQSKSKSRGSWGSHPFYRYGSNVLSWIGNEALTTAYALAALDHY